jgi:glycosyltransferase involved in cell wall biosynthesis
LNFLSINRFERKKNLDLAISAFALLRSVASTLPGDALQEATLTVAGDFCLHIYFPSSCMFNVTKSRVLNNIKY